MTEKVKFHPNDTEYTKADLDGMDVDALLKLRNLVASNIGAAAVKTFKDKPTAVDATWKALTKYAETAAADGEPAKTKPKKEPKERALAKPAEAGHVKRPTRQMFDTIKIVEGANEKEKDRAHRWPNYKDGMMVIDAIEGEGTCAWDIKNWASKGLMEIVPSTDEQYSERRAAWYKKHGREDPELSKERKAKERAEAAEKKKAEAAAKKKAAEEKKAAAEAAKAAEAEKKNAGAPAAA